MNGIVSAIILCFFLVHSLMGSIAAVAPFPNTLAWTVWIGVGLIALHVVLSIATSREQMTDAEFPPSPRKKRHLALKWATGILLITAVCAHVACVQTFGADAFQAELAGAFVTVAVITLFAVHVCVGMKSLIVDLDADRKLIVRLRILVTIMAIVCGVLALFGALR